MSRPVHTRSLIPPQDQAPTTPALAAGISPRRAPSPVPTPHTSLRHPRAKGPCDPRAKSAPSYPREEIRHTRACRGYLAAPSTKPRPNLPHLPPPPPRKKSPPSPRKELRHTRAKSSVIPARRDPSYPRKELRHTRAKRSVIPARRDPSYPRLPRVSRRAEHQAPSQPPTPPFATPTQKVPTIPAQRAPSYPREQTPSYPREEIRHTRACRGYLAAPSTKPRPNLPHLPPPPPRKISSVIPTASAGTTKARTRPSGGAES